MSLIWLKLLGGILFLFAALTAFFSMMSMMGRESEKPSPRRLRLWHRASGGFAFVLWIGLMGMGIRLWTAHGEAASPRVVWHAVLALTLGILLFVKILIANRYKKFLRMAPVLGMILFCLSILVLAVSGGYYILRSMSAPTPPDESSPAQARTLVTTADPATGRILFAQKCRACHHVDSRKPLLGPGLLGIFKTDAFPSGRPADRENMVRQLRQPMASMPAFPDLTEKEIDDLLAYLKTL